MAMNITFQDLREVVIPKLLDKVDTTRLVASTKEVRFETSIRVILFNWQLFAKWSPLLKKFVHGEEDQQDTIDVISDHLLQSNRVKTFSLILHVLYDVDLLEEEVIVAWYEEAEEEASLQPLRDDMKKFVDWLNEAEEESDQSIFV